MTYFEFKSKATSLSPVKYILYAGIIMSSVGILSSGSIETPMIILLGLLVLILILVSNLYNVISLDLATNTLFQKKILAKSTTHKFKKITRIYINLIHSNQTFSSRANSHTVTHRDYVCFITLDGNKKVRLFESKDKSKVLTAIKPISTLVNINIDDRTI